MHAVVACEVEVLAVQTKLSARENFEQLTHLLDIGWPSVRRQPHHLVLAVVYCESEVRGERAVEETKRRREPDLLEEFDPSIGAAPVGCRRPFADRVHGEDRGFAKSGEVERASRMRQVVVAEDHFTFVAEYLSDFLDRSPHCCPQLKTTRLRQVGPELRQLSTELSRGCFVISNDVHVADRQSAVLEAPPEGRQRKPTIVLSSA